MTQILVSKISMCLKKKKKLWEWGCALEQASLTIIQNKLNKRESKRALQTAHWNDLFFNIPQIYIL